MILCILQCYHIIILFSAIFYEIGKNIKNEQRIIAKAVDNTIFEWYNIGYWKNTRPTRMRKWHRRACAESWRACMCPEKGHGCIYDFTFRRRRMY